MDSALSRPQPGFDAGGDRRRGKIGVIFLRRLRRLIDLRVTRARHLNAAGVRLLNRAIYSTVRDLTTLGMKREARSLIQCRRRRIRR